MNALSINGNTARHLSISFIKLVSNEWSESWAKLKQSIVCLWKRWQPKAFFPPKKTLENFLKHPNDNQMGNHIPLSHHAKQYLPYFPAAVTETEWAEDENDSEERSWMEWTKRENDRVKVQGKKWRQHNRDKGRGRKQQDAWRRKITGFSRESGEGGEWNR